MNTANFCSTKNDSNTDPIVSYHHNSFWKNAPSPRLQYKHGIIALALEKTLMLSTVIIVDEQKFYTKA